MGGRDKIGGMRRRGRDEEVRGRDEMKETEKEVSGRDTIGGDEMGDRCLLTVYGCGRGGKSKSVVSRLVRKG